MGRLTAQFFAPSYVQEVPAANVDNNTTAYTLSQTPAAAAAVVIFINGVLQLQGTDYTLSGTTVTIASAPQSGSTITAFYPKQA